MTRGLAVVLLLGMCAGCRAPAPSLGCMTPYMKSTVPPPRTGAVGSGGMYYAPPASGAAGSMSAAPPAAPPPGATSAPTAPGGGAPVFTAPSQPLTPPKSFMGASTGSLDASHVSLASFQAGRPDEIGIAPEGAEETSATTGQARVSNTATDAAGAAGTASSNTLKLRGMPVNDATEPAALPGSGSGSEPKEIPSAAGAANGNSPSFLKFINPRTGNSSGSTGTPTQPPASTSVAGTWQSR